MSYVIKDSKFSSWSLGYDKAWSLLMKSLNDTFFFEKKENS